MNGELLRIEAVIGMTINVIYWSIGDLGTESRVSRASTQLEYAISTALPSATNSQCSNHRLTRDTTHRFCIPFLTNFQRNQRKIIIKQQ